MLILNPLNVFQQLVGGAGQGKLRLLEIELLTRCESAFQSYGTKNPEVLRGPSI